MERPRAVRTPTGRRVAALGSLAGVLLLLAAAMAAPAQAAPGDLDLTFSGDGKQRTDFGFGLSSAAATVRQPDGKIVAVGRVSAGGSGDFALARYNTDGSLDTSFSGDGRQTTDFVGSDRANGVALQADGKIVAVGEDGDDFALARYNPNGSVDTAFSGDGKQTTDLGGRFNPDRATGVAIQADGKIVAVGVAGATSGSRPDEPPDDFGLARYNPNGTLDTSFSGDGKQRTDFFGEDDEANGVAIQANGKIVAVGDIGDFALARYNPNGSLDTSFSGDGKQNTDFGGFFDGAAAVTLQADGKIVAVGFAGATSADRDFALARYNPNGSLDTGFSGDGKQNTDVGGAFDGANGVALQADGKVVAVGFAGATSAAHDFALVRYNTDGSLDTSFSGDGKQTTDFGGLDGANGVAVQGDGKVVALGTADESGLAKMALARYNTDGSLDTSFSADGKRTTNFAGFDEASGVAIQADGKIVAVGDDLGDFALARYNTDGSLDTSFSGDGRRTTDFGGADDGAAAVALQADGKIVAVGFAGATSAPHDFAVARYNTDGSLDTSFSGDGKQRTDFFGEGEEANGVAIQGDGKIVVVGHRFSGADDNFALARYNPNGSLDTTFSGDGRQTTDFGGLDGARGVAIRGDGKIVAVGERGPYPADFALARYNPNGTLDTSFSGDGKQTTNFGGDDAASGVVLQTSGRIVAAGVGGPPGFALARYNPNGTLDTSFSGDGKQTTLFGGGGTANGVALPGDGKIVAAGVSGTYPEDFALARYNPNGTLDTSFSGDGKQTTDFGGVDGASGVALQGDGKIVAVGGGRGIDGTTDFALARYLSG